MAKEEQPKIARAIDAWHRHAMIGFASLIKDQDCDLTDKDTFTSLVKAAIDHYDVKPSEIANHFGVDASTISRWTAGRNAPHPMARPVIIEWIGKHIESEARRVAGDTALIEKPRIAAFGH